MAASCGNLARGSEAFVAARAAECPYNAVIWNLLNQRRRGRLTTKPSDLSVQRNMTTRLISLVVNL